MSGGGRFDFDDGGTYCGGWEEGKAHGHGVCTGPKGQGEYAGAWQLGFELNGVYLWPSGNRYEGQWTQGKRHGLGAETKGRWSYKGEWTQGFKGRYGVRLSTSTGAKYEGTWTTGLQDGYGVETYADGGEYKGQWLRGMRHGYGSRQSVPYGVAASYHAKTHLHLTSPTSAATSHASDVDVDDVGNSRERGVNRADESRGGFVLKSRSDDTAGTGTAGRRSFLDKHSKGPLGKILRLSLRKQRSTGDIHEPNGGSRRQMGASMRSTVSTTSRQSNDSGKTALTSASSDSNHSFVTQDDAIDAGVIETYTGEWKNDKRSGFGVSERTDGLRYVGEWYNNKKYGYGVTTLRDGRKEEGKYKNNVLVTAGNKSKLLFAIRSSKLRERIDSAVAAAVRAGQIARQKADIAVSRMQTAKAKAELAELSSQKARADAETARQKAKEFAPDYQQQTGPSSYQKASGGAPSPGESEFIKQTVAANHASLNNSKSNSSTSNNMATYNFYPSTPATMSIMSGAPQSPQPTNSNNSKADFASNKHQRQSTASSGLSASASQTSTGLTLTPSKVNSLDRSPSSNASFQRQDSGSAPSSRQRNTDSLRRHGDRSDASLPRRGGSGLPGDNGSPVTDDDRGSSYYSGGAGRGVSPSRDSDVTASDYGSLTSRGTQPRRKSLPSIVKNKEGAIVAAQQSTVTSSATLSREQKRKAQQSRMRPEVEYGPDYVIENGVRKRITTDTGGASGLSRQDTVEVRQGLGEDEDEEGEDAVADLPRRYRVETPRLQRRAGANLGSLPDVSVCQELSQAVMPREEVYVLSERRRDELRRQREEEERRRHMQVVLSLYDFKDWCHQRQMLMLILALNIGLATMFFNLLSR